jgi:phosphocarrier protein HPr
VRQIELRVDNGLGLHARAAARFVELASRFAARITVGKGTLSVDGKSILGLLTLAAEKGSLLRIRAEGEDEEPALAALAELVGRRFGEPA